MHIIVPLIANVLTVTAATSIRNVQATEFYNITQSDSLVLTYFYADGHAGCGKVAATLEEVSEQVSNVTFVEVHCLTEFRLCDDVGVFTLPQIRLSRKEQRAIRYEGEVDSSSILSFIHKQFRAPVTKISPGELSEFGKTDEAVIVANIGANDSKSMETYHHLAEQFQGQFLFGITSVTDETAEMSRNLPSLTITNKMSDTREEFTGDFTLDVLTSFVESHSISIIGEIGPESYTLYVESGLPLAQIFASSPRERIRLTAELLPIALKYKDSVNFALIDAVIYKDRARIMQLPPDRFPAFAIENVTSSEKYPFLGEHITANAISKFLDDYFTGILQPSVRSQPVPNSQSGKSIELVGASFREIAYDENKDVLVEFYVPWCEYCQHLHQTLEDLAILYEDLGFSSQIVIAKVDVSQNDVPERIEQYPEIKLYAAGNPKSVRYNGTYHEQLSLTQLSSFIKQEGRHGIGTNITIQQLHQIPVASVVTHNSSPTSSIGARVAHDEV